MVAIHDTNDQQEEYNVVKTGQLSPQQHQWTAIVQNISLYSLSRKNV